MADLMTKEEGEELARLLTKVREVNEGFIPDPAYWPLQKLVAWAAVEVLITRTQADGRPAVLLRKRSNDPLGLNGWHIVGGYIKPGETTLTACLRHAKEDANVAGLTNLRLIGCHQWLDHPLGWPFSSLIVCDPVGEVTERDDLKFFTSIPTEPMIHPTHMVYLRVFFTRINLPLQPMIIG